MTNNQAPPPVATLILLRGGAAQMLRILGRKGRYDFHYAPGAGHVRAYSSLDEFHAEELEIRSIPQQFAIITRFGALDASEAAAASLRSVIADGSGHAGAKRDRLLALREMIDAEVRRLESLGVGIPHPPTIETPQVQTPPREQAKADRRAELRRAGEEHVRSIVNDLGLGVPKLNNFHGMIDAIIAAEFRKPRDPSVLRTSNDGAAV